MSRIHSPGETLTSIVVVLVVAFVLWVASSMPYMLPPEEMLTAEQILEKYKPSSLHSDFIKKISEELKLTKNVYLILVPTRDLRTKGVLIPKDSAYYIFADETFLTSLSDIEQKALIGHEMGHIIFGCPGTEIVFLPACQTGADLFAAMHTSPDATMSMLHKLYSDQQWNPEYKIRIEHMKQLQGKVILPGH